MHKYVRTKIKLVCESVHTHTLTHTHTHTNAQIRTHTCTRTCNARAHTQRTRVRTRANTLATHAHKQQATHAQSTHTHIHAHAHAHATHVHAHTCLACAHVSTCALEHAHRQTHIICLQTTNQDFQYTQQANPKRALTKPSEGIKNDGHDNEHSDLVLYVSDALVHNNPSSGTIRTYTIQEMLGQVGGYI